ncbi:MAG TPA: aldehyde dehydrogenase family protein, partial [Flavisolibacter sp.]|nr:aldehyde dehydrogenase family protein [Flavisolibacter sp.]
MSMSFTDAIPEEIERAVKTSWAAFQKYKLLDLKERAAFLRLIAEKMEARRQPLLEIANRETHLPLERLQIEFTRTQFQLTSYAKACEEGTWLDIRIDTEKNLGTRIQPDLRKMLIPLGPVVVFGASNFPFAYSTAGGDTACALAAGCPVIIKAHPAHGQTSDLMAGCIKEAAQDRKLPEGIFIHIHGSGFEVGKALVMHPLTRAVGFTGSVEGGRALFDLAGQRPMPIPVFAEMGS